MNYRKSQSLRMWARKTWQVAWTSIAMGLFTALLASLLNNDNLAILGVFFLFASMLHGAVTWGLHLAADHYLDKAFNEIAVRLQEEHDA